MDKISGIAIFRKTPQALCRFTGTIEQSGLPQHSQWIASVYQSTHFYTMLVFRMYNWNTCPFWPFQRPLGSEVWLHWHCTDHGAIPVRCHPFRSLVGSSGTAKVSHGGDLSSAPWLGCIGKLLAVWSFGNIDFSMNSGWGSIYCIIAMKWQVKSNSTHWLLLAGFLCAWSFSLFVVEWG